MPPESVMPTPWVAAQPVQSILGFVAPVVAAVIVPATVRFLPCDMLSSPALAGKTRLAPAPNVVSFVKVILLVVPAVPTLKVPETSAVAGSATENEVVPVPPLKIELLVSE